MLEDKSNYAIEEVLDEIVYFKIKDKEGKVVYRALTLSEINEKVTLRNIYNELQKHKLKGLNRKKAFTLVETEQLLEDRKSGMSIRALAAKYGKSTTTIEKYIKKGLVVKL